jgi:hypothetical protein
MPEGVCKSCGRFFSDRASWRSRGVSSEVRYCSAQCRRARPNKRDHALERELLVALLAHTSPLELSVLSERLRVPTEQGAQRRLRCALRRLSHLNALTLTQNGRAVQPGQDRGPLSVYLSKEQRERLS